MEINMEELRNSSQICKYTRACIDLYIEDPDNNKEKAIKQLSVVFSQDSDLRKKIIKMNKLTVTAERIIRETRFAYLKDLLIEIDEKHYKNLRF